MPRLTPAVVSVTTLSLILLVAITSARSTEAQTLLETARAHDPRNGQLEITSCSSTPARSVAELLSESDLVVHGLVVEAVPEMNDDQTAIFTRVSLQPLREFSRRPATIVPTDPRGNLHLRQIGGRLRILGRDVLMRDCALEPFTDGEQVVVFLKFNRDAAVYEILYVPYGCFHVRNGRVEAIGVAADTLHRDVNGLDVAAFSATIGDMASVR